MIAAAEDDMYERVAPSGGIKKELLVADLINHMEIADGLKELLNASALRQDPWYR